MPRLLVYLVRHGETNENSQNIIQGQLNTQLNENGRHQIRLLAEGLKSYAFAYAYSSDLDRAVETAQAVLVHHPNLILIIQPGLRERYFGELQGKVRTGKPHPPSVEPIDVFITRLLRWWDTTITPLSQNSESDKVHSTSESFLSPEGSVPITEDPNAFIQILVIGHGASLANLMKALVSQRNFDASDVRELGRMHNTGVSIVEVHEDGSGRIRQYSGVDHLQNDEGGEGVQISSGNADDVDRTGAQC